MAKECKCDSVKRYDDYWQCIRGECRRLFIPKDMSDARIAQLQAELELQRTEIVELGWAANPRATGQF